MFDPVIEPDKVPYLASSIVTLLKRALTSESLLLSLASAEYHCKEIKAIVPRIANIVTTTISSTNVKAFFVLLIIRIKVKK
jgi:hypothetical protein